MASKKLLIPVVLAVGAALALFLLRSQVKAPGVSQNSSQQVQTAAGFDKKQYSIDQLGSIWQIVNKKRPLPSNYVPSDLVVPGVKLRLAASEEQMHIRKVAEPDLVAMFNAATKDGVQLVFGSGYRSYALQKQFYDSYVAKDGVAAADRYSARPGTSEHQTGLAFDVTSASGKCHLEICFENTPEGQWVKSHAHEYGFIIRYQNGTESITGYQYEPWHLRYVGRDLATEINKTNLTLEQFFNLN